MTKKPTSGSPMRSLGGQRQEKGRQVTGTRGKASDAVRAQILKNPQQTKPVASEDVGRIVLVEGKRNVSPIQDISERFVGGAAATAIAKDLLGVGISRSVEGGNYYLTTYGEIPKLRRGMVGISGMKGALDGIEIVPVDDLAGAVHAIWDQPAGFLGHEHPSSTISVELGEHEIVGELPEALSLSESVEQFNLLLHSLEGVDTRGLEYPGSDEPAELPDWPAGLSAAPYKMK